jgi:hypothetical protein
VEVIMSVFLRSAIMASLVCVINSSHASEIPELTLDRGEILRAVEVYGAYGEYRVNSYEGVDGSMRIVVLNQTGAKAFESFYPIIDDDGVHVVWRYLEEKDYVSKSALVPENRASPTLEGMKAAARDIVHSVAKSRRTGRGLQVEDTWGCDLPSWLGGAELTCSSSGNCCDMHDDCYALFDCTAASWLTGYVDQQCLACNALIVACLTVGVENTGEPSVCCSVGNCGVTRTGFGGGGHVGGPDINQCIPCGY